MAGEGKAKLTIESELKGGEATAKGLDKISTAQKSVTGQVASGASETKKAAEAQQSLNASESDFIGLLALISPALAQYADGAIKAAKVSGDLASQNLDLTKILGSATASVSKHANTLKLIGAGGAVAAAVLGIVRAVASMREELEAATKAAKALIAAQNELKGVAADQLATTEKLSAQRSEGPFTAGEASAADAALKRLGKSVPFTSEASRQQAVVVGGPSASADTLSQLAIAIDQPGARGSVDVGGLLSRSAASRPTAVSGLLGSRSGDIATIRQRELSQAADQAQEALREAGSQGGSTFALENFINQLPGQGGLSGDTKKLASVVSGLRGIEGKELTNPLDVLPIALQQFGSGASFADLQTKAELLKGEGVTAANNKRVSEGLVRQAELILQQLNNIVSKLDNQPPAIQNFQNAKFVGPDAHSQRRSITNGERSLRESEGG